MKKMILLTIFVLVVISPLAWIYSVVNTDYSPIITITKTSMGDSVWTVPISPYHPLHPYVETKYFNDPVSAMRYKSLIDSLVIKTSFHQP